MISSALIPRELQRVIASYACDDVLWTPGCDVAFWRRAGFAPTEPRALLRAARCGDVKLLHAMAAAGDTRRRLSVRVLRVLAVNYAARHAPNERATLASGCCHTCTLFRELTGDRVSSRISKVLVSRNLMWLYHATRLDTVRAIVSEDGDERLARADLSAVMSAAHAGNAPAMRSVLSACLILARDGSEFFNEHTPCAGADEAHEAHAGDDGQDFYTINSDDDLRGEFARRARAYMVRVEGATGDRANDRVAAQLLRVVDQRELLDAFMRAESYGLNTAHTDRAFRRLLDHSRSFSAASCRAFISAYISDHFHWVRALEGTRFRALVRFTRQRHGACCYMSLESNTRVLYYACGRYATYAKSAWWIVNAWRRVSFLTRVGVRHLACHDTWLGVGLLLAGVLLGGIIGYAIR